MAQTKRKRRTKHRGNAVGAIESRGRTGRKLTPQERKRGGERDVPRGIRPMKPPTMQSAALKAGFGALMLFFIVQLGLFGGNTSTTGALGLAAFAWIFYTPIMYLTDKWLYNRRNPGEAGKAKR